MSAPAPVLGRAVSQETALNDLFLSLILTREPPSDFDAFFQNPDLTSSNVTRNFIIEGINFPLFSNELQQVNLHISTGELLPIYILAKNFKSIAYIVFDCI